MRHHRFRGRLNSDYHQVWRWEDIPVAKCQSLGIFALPALLGLGYSQAEVHMPQDRSQDMQTRATPLRQVPLVVSLYPVNTPLSLLFPSRKVESAFSGLSSKTGQGLEWQVHLFLSEISHIMEGFTSAQAHWVHLIQPPSGTILSISLGYYSETLLNQRRHSGHFYKGLEARW